MNTETPNVLDSFEDILNLLEKYNLCVVPISFVQTLVNNANGGKQCENCLEGKVQTDYHSNVLSKLDELIDTLKFSNLRTTEINRKPTRNIRTPKVRNRKRSVFAKNVNRKTSSSTDENNRDVPRFEKSRKLANKLPSVLKNKTQEKSNGCRLVQRSVHFETSDGYYSGQFQSKNPFQSGNLGNNPFSSNSGKCVVRNPFLSNPNESPWAGFPVSNELPWSRFCNSAISLIRSDLSLYQYQANLESMQSQVSEWRKRINEIDGQIDTLISSSEELESSGDEQASVKLILF